jgi:hypothetical protein
MYGDFYEFNPLTNSWIQKNNFGGSARYLAAAFTIGNRGFIGTGADNTTTKKDFWEYNPFNDSWTQKNDFAGAARYHSTGISSDNVGYLAGGYIGQPVGPIVFSDFWEYIPVLNKISVEQFSDITFCAGDNFVLQHKTYGAANAGNIFTVQLSDSTGNFSSPVNVGTTAGTYSGAINVTIPLSTIPASGYRIRVVSSNPVINGDDNGADINVRHCALISLKLFIEGYYLSNGMMTAVIDPVNNPLICDTLTIELHEDDDPFQLVQTKNTILQTDGNVSALFDSIVLNQDYYIAVKHRNAMETWSASPMTLYQVNFYDFTSNIAQAYGNNMKTVHDQFGYAIYSGDISDAAAGIGNQDGLIEGQDYSDMENAVYSILTGYTFEDITGDGVVEGSDYSIMENNVYYVITLMRP